MVVQKIKIMNEVTNTIMTAMTDDRNVKTKNESISIKKLHNTQSFIDTSGSFICTQQSIRREYHGRFPF